MKRSIHTVAIVSLTDDVLARATFGRYHTVASYLRRYGVPATWIAQWGSAFGRKAARLGTPVGTTWENGRLVAVYADTVALDAAMAHYASHKDAGPQLTAGYDRKRAAKRQLRDARGRFARAYVVTWVGPIGANARGRLTAERAARLVRKLTADYRMTNVIVQDTRGHRADFSLAV